METCPVRFDFITEFRGKFKHVHNIPRSLVTVDSQDDPAYLKELMATVQGIAAEHEAECFAASNTKCNSCGSPTVKVLMTPMSYLHLVDKPFVNIIVNPICGKSICEMRTRQEIQDIMAMTMREFPGKGEGAGSRDTMEILPCRVCGETEKMMRCSRCKVVAYCGKEHQKADWKVHKKICASLMR